MPGRSPTSTPDRAIATRIAWRTFELTTAFDESARPGVVSALAATPTTSRASRRWTSSPRTRARPVEFRVDNLDDDRLVTVLRAAAERFGWVRDGSGVGQASRAVSRRWAYRYRRAGSRRRGSPRVLRLVTAYECGAVVNPDTVINQIEGATSWPWRRVIRSDSLREV